MTERDESTCPHLGLMGDRSTLFIYPTPLHRCFRPIAPVAIHPDDQETFCLGGNWQSCPRVVGPADTEMRAPEDSSPADVEMEPEADPSAWESWESVAPVRPPTVDWRRRLLILSAMLLFICPSVALLVQSPDVQALMRRLPVLMGMMPTATPTATKTPIRIVPGVTRQAQAFTPVPLRPTSDATAISTWTPTITPSPTMTATPTWTHTHTPAPTDTAAPSDTPAPTETFTPTPTFTFTPTPIPSATPTPLPQYRVRGAPRYFPSCSSTKVYGYVYDEFGDPIPGVYVKLWNDWGYTAPLQQTDGSTGENGVGYYEVFLDTKPKEGIWYVAIADPVDEQVISQVVSVKTTEGECHSDSAGRQVVQVDWSGVSIY